jgi:signal transduction histidine kinase
MELRLPENLPPLHGVRDQFVQIFLNLILNAMDATGKGGQITISAEDAPGEVRVLVSDNGSGISLPHSARLFQPYFTTKKNGTGLGLFVTRKLVTDHGGTIDFESQPGEGTTFRLRLPIETETANGDRELAAESDKLTIEI